MGSKDLGMKDYSLVEEGKPFKSYIKTILGSIWIRVLNPFTQEIENILLQGNPKDKDKENCIVDVWSSKEDHFFVKVNKIHLDNGFIIEYNREKQKEKVSEIKNINTISEEELEEIVNSKFFSLQSSLEKMDSIAIVFRMMEKAKELEKSEKIVNVIEARLTELQKKEYEPLEQKE